MENPPHVDHFCIVFVISLRILYVLEGITGHCSSPAQGKSKEAVNGRYDAEPESGHFALLGEPS